MLPSPAAVYVYIKALSICSVRPEHTLHKIKRSAGAEGDGVMIFSGHLLAVWKLGGYL
jgi:hypothetical protein